MQSPAGMRRFFKPVEIDDEMEENFDLSTLRVNTSAGHNENTTNSFNSMTENQFEGFNPNEISLTAENKLKTEQMLNELRDSMADNNNKAEKIENKPLDFMTLKTKFEENYSCYCAENKKRKWNAFDEKVSKSAFNDKSLPPIIREFLVKLKEESNEYRVYRTKSSEWSNRSFDEEMVVACLLSILKGPEKKASPVKKDDVTVGLQPNMFDDSQLSFVMQIDHESKYASQLKPQYERKPPTIDQITSSTPHKALSVMPKSALPVHSPIVKAPLVSAVGHKRQKASDKRVDKNDPNWYLTYFAPGFFF